MRIEAVVSTVWKYGVSSGITPGVVASSELAINTWDSKLATNTPMTCTPSLARHCTETPDQCTPPTLTLNSSTEMVDGASFVDGAILVVPASSPSGVPTNRLLVEVCANAVSPLGAVMCPPMSSLSSGYTSVISTTVG